MKAQEIIHAHHLSSGACREQIIEVFIQHPHALSEQEVKEKLGDQFDRTSIYRTFKTLLENKVLHQIVVEKGLVKYVMNQTENLQTPHAHFYCNDCGKVVCIEQVLPELSIEKQDFKVVSTEMILKGHCADCNLNP